MSKVVWVVMGLIVAVMAVGFASQRHWFEPQTRTRIITPSANVATVPPSSLPQSSAPSSSMSGPAVRKPASDASSNRAARRGWEAFDLVVNVLNVVVGIAGIWMTVHGMRMQRMALAAEQARAR